MRRVGCVIAAIRRQWKVYQVGHEELAIESVLNKGYQELTNAAENHYAAGVVKVSFVTISITY